jgi:D-amino peptidase
MKIYISTDLEGISGVVDWKQTGRDERGADYAQACHLLTADVNAAVEGALAAGVEEIVVLDGHGGGRNFIYSELRAGARYITGAGRVSVFPGLDNSFDALLLVGYHAMAGTRGAVMDHTMSSLTWYNYYLNGTCLGEIGISAVIAGHFGVPVAFVSGDTAACTEAAALLGDIETAAVKHGLWRTSAELLPLSEAHALLRTGVTNALQKLGTYAPYVIEPPIEVRLETQNTDVADHYEREGWQRLAGRTVQKIAQNALDIL